MKTAAAYASVSSDKQSETSIDAQLSEAYLEEMKITVVSCQ
ncbi:MAG TPA: hypothetical protein PLP59_11055 [Thermotogota bacterium]|nr:hypothetical protein [Thermotogota bacterium]HPH11316.1 hypothetical protein [Thermotogota bacterium]HQN22203.1 hypothetical protein [Thermotogota bacterium]